MTFYHNSSIANMFHSLLRSLLGERADTIQVGCEFGAVDGRLDALFKYPTEEVARFRLLNRFRIFLTEHFRNQHEFELEAPFTSDDDASETEV